MADDLIIAGEAQKRLGISKKKMAELLDKGILASEPDPLDKRVKLVSAAAVEALRASSTVKKDAA